MAWTSKSEHLSAERDFLLLCHSNPPLTVYISYGVSELSKVNNYQV